MTRCDQAACRARARSAPALVGRRDATAILVGPFAFGRGTHFVVPHGQRLEVLRHEAGSDPFAMLIVRNGAEDHWLLALATGSAPTQRRGLVGLLGRSDLTRAQADRQAALVTAAARFAQTLDAADDGGAAPASTAWKTRLNDNETQ